MLVRQCVHLLFLALDLHNDDDGHDASEGADVDMTDLRAHESGHSDAYYAAAETCQQVASDMVYAMDLGMDDSNALPPAPPQGDDDVEAQPMYTYIAETSLNMPADVRPPRVVGFNSTGQENFLYDGADAEACSAASSEGVSAMGTGPKDGQTGRKGILDQICYSHQINGDGGFDDREGLIVSHSSMHAVSHRASILSLLVRLAKKLPKASDLLAQEGVESLLADVAATQHEGCARALVASGYNALDVQGQADADERARMKKMAADRQARMMEQMKMQQAAAAAHMMLDDDEIDDDDDSGQAALSAKSCVDALAQLEGSQCVLCQENMATSGVKWSRWDNANESWIEYSEDTCAELEKAREQFEVGMAGKKVEILLHGDSYVVDLERMRQTGPVDEGGVRPGRETRCKVRRIVNETMLLGFSHPSPLPCFSSYSDAGDFKKRHSLVITLCGHAMHKTCLNRYISSLVARRHHIIHGSTFEQAHAIDFDQGEFVCAICRRVANTALPVCRISALNPPGKVGQDQEDGCDVLVGSDIPIWRWADTIAGDAGVAEQGWRDMFGWNLWPGLGVPPSEKEGPHASLWLAMSRVNEAGKWTRTQPLSKIASRDERVDKAPLAAEKIARLVADQVAARELSSRGLVLELEDARASRAADDKLSPTALLISTLRHHMVAAAARPEPAYSDSDKGPPWSVISAWVWLCAQCHTPRVWVGGGCSLGSEDAEHMHSASHGAQEAGAGKRPTESSDVRSGLAALHSHLQRHLASERMRLFEEGQSALRDDEKALQLLDLHGQGRQALFVAGGPCLLTCDLFLLFTALLAHRPPVTGDHTMGGESAFGAAGAAGKGTAGGGELPLARLVRVLYTAQITQIMVALYEEFVNTTEKEGESEVGSPSPTVARSGDGTESIDRPSSQRDEVMMDGEMPGVRSGGGGGWGLREMLQVITSTSSDRVRPCTMAAIAVMIERQAGFRSAEVGGRDAPEASPEMRVAQVCKGKESCRRVLFNAKETYY